MASEYVELCEQCGVTPLPEVCSSFEQCLATGDFLLRGVAGGCRLTYDQCAPLSAGLQVSGVSGISLPNHNLVDDAVEAFFSEKVYSSVTSLNLSENSIGWVGARALAKHLPSACPNLQELVLDGCPLGEAGGCAVATLVEAHPTLSILRVAQCDLQMDAIIAITSALARTSSLNVLDISGVILFSRNEETTGHIARALVGNGTIVRLAMRKHPKITDTSVEWMCDALLDNAVLRELDMSLNALGPPSGVSFAKALSSGANLSVLQLSGCRLGDEGACALAAVLGGGGVDPVCGLNHLDLRKNSIGAVGVAALMAALEHPACPLQQLLLGGNPGLAPGPGAEAVSSALLSGVLRTAMDLEVNTVDGEAQVAEIIL